MGRKKVSGLHSTPRTVVQLPEDWANLVKKLAADRQMPAMWLIVELIKREAEAKKASDIPLSHPWDVK